MIFNHYGRDNGTPADPGTIAHSIFDRGNWGATDPATRIYSDDPDDPDDPDGPDITTRDDRGNLTAYTIGAGDGAREVTVSYDYDTDPDVPIARVQIRRSGGESIVYERQTHWDAWRFVYAESRNGRRSDLLYGVLEIDSAGRIDLYLDYEKKRKALSYDPSTGLEEYGP